jgi:hypothetical protein
VVRECLGEPWRLITIVGDEVGVSKVKVPVSCFATMGISALYDRRYPFLLLLYSQIAFIYKHIDCHSPQSCAHLDFPRGRLRGRVLPPQHPLRRPNRPLNGLSCRASRHHQESFSRE